MTSLARFFVPLLAAITSACAASSSRNHFEVDLKRDIPGTLAMFAVAKLIDSEKHDWNGMRSCAGDRRAPTEEERLAFQELPEDGEVCDGSELLPIDAWVTGLNWSSAGTLSDIGLFSMLALPFGVSAVDTIANTEEAKRFGVDAVVISQAYGATMLAGTILKIAARRPRPYTYNKVYGKSLRFSGDARLSFPSNHTSMAFAGASVSSMVLIERYGITGGSVAGIVGSYLGAATVGSLRMMSGRHFLTDVLVGAAIGTVFGILVPSVHLDRSLLRGAEEVSSTAHQRAYVPVVSFGGGW